MFFQTENFSKLQLEISGPHKVLSRHRVLGPHRVLRLPRVLGPHRIVGPHKVLGPRSRFSSMLTNNANGDVPVENV